MLDYCSKKRKRRQEKKKKEQGALEVTQRHENGREWPLSPAEGITCVQDAADHSCHHHEEHGQQLEVPTHHAASLHMRHVFG